MYGSINQLTRLCHLYRQAVTNCIKLEYVFPMSLYLNVYSISDGYSRLSGIKHDSEMEGSLGSRSWGRKITCLWSGSWWWKSQAFDLDLEKEDTPSVGSNGWQWTKQRFIFCLLVLAFASKSILSLAWKPTSSESQNIQKTSWGTQTCGLNNYYTLGFSVHSLLLLD